jgi:hypothetical protein
MQTFRAYIQNPAGTITWAAWIEAADRDEAQGKANALCPGPAPSVDLWSASERRIDASWRLEPV